MPFMYLHADGALQVTAWSDAVNLFNDIEVQFGPRPDPEITSVYTVSCREVIAFARGIAVDVGNIFGN